MFSEPSGAFVLPPDPEAAAHSGPHSVIPAISAVASLIIRYSEVSYAVTSTFPEVTASSKCRTSHHVVSRPAACTSHNG